MYIDKAPVTAMLSDKLNIQTWQSLELNPWTVTWEKENNIPEICLDILLYFHIDPSPAFWKLPLVLDHAKVQLTFDLIWCANCCFKIIFSCNRHPVLPSFTKIHFIWRQMFEIS